jgi:hypothetical protein
MNLYEYQIEAMTFAPPDTLGDQVHGLVVTALGLSGEALELEKAIIFQGFEAEVKECGDCFWYLARGATALGVDLFDIDQGARGVSLSRFLSRRELATELLRIGAEFGECVKKIYGQGHAVDVPKLQGLLSDYYGVLSRIVSIGQLNTEGDILEANIAKLRGRFPDGFTVEASVGRIEG